MHRFIQPLSLGMLLCSLAGGCATIRRFNPIESRTLEARQLTQQAESAMHRSDWDNAELKLVTAVERCPNDNRARACLAEVLWQRGAKKAAVEQLSKSIELSGRRDPVELTELGRMHLAMGNPLTALQFADEAIGRDESQAAAWTLRGFALNEQGRSKEALAAYFRSLSLRNDDPQTRLEIARIYRELGEPQRALAILDAAATATPDQTCPHHADVCYLRGLLLRDLQRPGDAVLAFLAARESGCTSPDLLLCLADAQLSAGEIPRARDTLIEAAAQSGPEDAAVLAELRRRVDVTESAETSMWR